MMKRYRTFLLFALLILVFVSIQFSSQGALDGDVFLHTKLATFIRTGSILKGLPWAQFSVMKESYSDFSFLYHAILALLISLPRLFADKVFSVFLMTLLFYVFYRILKKERVSYSWFYTLLLLSSSSFLFRLSLARPFNLAIILSVFCAYFIWREKLIPIFLIALLFSLSYSSSFLIVIFAVLYLISKFLKREDINYKLLLPTFLGILVGTIIHPNFPHNIYINSLLASDVFRLPPVTAEMMPPSLVGLITGSSLICLLFLGLITLLILSGIMPTYFNKRFSTKGIFIFLISVSFGVLTIKSQRFVEYWVPFTVLAGALLARDFRLDKKFVEWLKKTWQKKRIALLPAALGGALLAIIIFTNSLGSNYLLLKNTAPYDRFQNAANWLKENTPEKSIIYNVFWDEFPELFYWDSQNYYIAGMDPTFLYEYDRGLYEKYNAIADGKEKNIANIVKNDFRSNYIFVGRGHNWDDLRKNLNDDQNISIAYEDNYAVIYQIK